MGYDDSKARLLTGTSMRVIDVGAPEENFEGEREVQRRVFISVFLSLQAMNQRM